jgi:SPP1 gp7 family putative phage head morphogenesis protein
MMPNTPYQMSFWDDDESEFWDEVATTLLEIYFSGVDGGVDALPPAVRVLADFDHVNTKALEFAKQYRYTLIKGITNTTRTQVQTAVSNWIQSGAPLDALEATLERTFGGVRAQMIAQTESTRVFAQANRDAFESTGLVDQVVWQTAVDDLVCPICGPLHGTHIGIGDIDALPPQHINCRCYVLPVVSEEALSRRLDEVLA